MKQKIKSISKESKIRPRKHLGQNFLIDHGILGIIADAAELTKDDVVLEIGAGTGILTETLEKEAGHVIAVEIDERLVSVLHRRFSQYSNVEVVKGDFLQLNLTELMASSTLISEKSKVVANLPYYITTPIILRLFSHAKLFERLVVLLQREVAERIVAVPGSKRYGAFSVVAQYYSDPEIITVVPPGAFWPQPKVDSAVVRMLIRETPRVNTLDEEMFFAVVRGGFAKRRKTILRALSMAGKTYPELASVKEDDLKRILAEVGVDSKRRAETITLGEFGQIADAIVLERSES
ncbi:MAG: 16S rRNA (adenine(1518)-N(6)/adenine(1519)-N(6))-dimethyltransferase RsmA [Firmicutes bacterium]|nr:16S rRNA (adenine(1518)-N(6)/adenine(1519)-N(6))-dimethyltransferase RsmA [Bacillota bacterium]HXL03906.1 16S rRNA (adenine(1518)-N(6)/adenine(1519)-N(6))-dimethyltransferase RsmA [Bacillota bacterium]